MYSQVPLLDQLWVSKAVKDHLPRRWAGVMAVGVGNTAKKLDLVIKRLHVLKAPKARIENNIKTT